MTKKDIYEKYIIPYLEKIREGRANEEEIKILPEMLEITLEYIN